VQVNGAAARLVRTGDKVIVASFGAFDERDLERYSPVVVHVNEANEVTAVDSDPTVLLGEGVMRGGSAGEAEEPPDSSEEALL
jgi:aspartate 1-decarboxylase